jgi:hypothetical protein
LRRGGVCDIRADGSSTGATRPACRWRRRWCRAASTEWAGSAKECNVLFSVEHVCDRRSHAAAHASLNIEQLFTFVGAVCDESPVRNDLDHQIARRRKGPATNAATAIAAPFFFLRREIPRNESATLAFFRSRPDCGWGFRRRRWSCRSVTGCGATAASAARRTKRDTHVLAAGCEFEIFLFV